MTIRTIISFISSFFSVTEMKICHFCHNSNSPICCLPLWSSFSEHLRKLAFVGWTYWMLSVWFLFDLSSEGQQHISQQPIPRVLDFSVCLSPSHPLPFLLSMCICICVCRCVPRHMPGGQKTTSSVNFTLFETGYLLCFWHTRLGGPRASGMSVSISHLAIGTLGLQMHTPASRLSWVLEV